jgi:voltage-gated potassium channel
LLSMYAFAVFGYITATLASFFVGSDAAEERSRSRHIEEELSALRAQVERLTTGG